MKESISYINLERIFRKAFCFFERQIRQIKRGGKVVLFRKVRALLLKVIDGILMIVAAPMVMAIRILRPFVVIRLAKLDSGRIGNLYPADWYLSKLHSDLQCKRRIDFFYFTSSNNLICNKQWIKMWKRILPHFPFGRIAHVVDKLNKQIPGYGFHTIPLLLLSDWWHSKDDSITQILKYEKANISFTPEEKNIGEKVLRYLGIPEGNGFICFHSRDSAYLDTLFPERNWRYHDYRDSDIQNYVPAMEELTLRGHYAIRMGAIVKEKMQTDNSAIIDYATNDKRNDFMDIYLGAKCRFFICSDTGLAIISEMFRRPIVYVNWVPLRRISTWCQNGLVIPKKFYFPKGKRFLTFKEIINSELGYASNGDIFKKMDVELIENMPEEIKAVAIEMDERLKGKWETTEEDGELQQRFWVLFGPDKLKSRELRIGAEFLRQNKELLA